MSKMNRDHFPELTVSAILVGTIAGIFLTAANVYLGLYAGMTVAASIPAAVIAMGVYRGLFKGKNTVLQSNIVQTIASAGESLAAGIIFTVPALLLVGAWNEFHFWPTTLIAIAGGVLGVIFMIPLRKALIVENKELVYPEGVACAEVLESGSEEGSSQGVISMLKGFLIGAAFKLGSSAFGFVASTVEVAKNFGGRTFFFGSDLSPALLSVGYIVNINIGTLMFLGGVIGWIIAIPMLGIPVDLSGESALDTAWTLWSTKVRYIGVGAMIVAGVSSIFQVRKGIAGGVQSLFDNVGKGPGKEQLRTERNLSMTTLGIVFILTLALVFGIYHHMTQNWGVTALTTVIMVVLSFFFVAVASYIVGLVGSSNSPVSGMTISALLATAVLFLVLGYEGESAILATLGVAAVVCCAACTSGDVCQDLKTGHLVGASPRSQQIVQLLGVVVPAFVIAPTLWVLQDQILDGTLRAPQAQLFAALTQGLFGEGSVPKDMVAYGAVLGVAILILDVFLKRSGSKMRLHLMPMAVGIYLPMSVSVPIFLGGLIRNRVEKAKGEVSETDSGVLMSSGLIAGESLLGVAIAALAVANLDLKIAGLSPVLTETIGIGAFAALLVYLYKSAMKSSKA